MRIDTHVSRKASDDNENLVHDKLQFADSLKDLKSLRKQLYSAAELYESSYNRDYHKQMSVMQLSKDYVAGALVSTVEHLGSVADKLDKFLDENSNQFSATIQTFSCIQQRLSAIEELVELQRMSMAEATRHAKHYVLPGKSCQIFSSSQSKQKSRMILNTSQSPVPQSFFFLHSKEAEQNKTKRRSISPFRFSLNRSGPDSKRSVSPSPYVSKTRCSSEPRRAISACRRRQDEDATKRDKQTETYTTRSKQLFRALVSIRRP